MNEIVLSQGEKTGLHKAIEHCFEWSRENQAAVGIAEIALGAGIIYWGIQNGMIQIGTDLVGSKLEDISGVVGAAVGGAATPIIASTILKSIFIGGVSGGAGVTMVPAIPVIALVGGGAAVFGAFGYTGASMIEKFFQPGFSDYLVEASIVTIGLALMVDGGRRLINDEDFLKVASNFKDGVINLMESSTEIVAKSLQDLQNIAAELAPKTTEEGVAQSAALIAGASIGGGIAAGSVTVLGSHALGAAALSLGLVSAPVWPVIAGGALGLAVGAAALKGVKTLKNKNLRELPPTGQLPASVSDHE